MPAQRTALVADIQRASVHDGPGLRTTVFFKGCPLHCAWCHNPECISFEPEELRYPDKCVGCGHCAQGCYSGARVKCGQEMTEDEVWEQIWLDHAYYREEGGATFSGGEPLCKADFVSALVDRCHAAGITAAVETSMILWSDEVLPKLDYIMADIKIWDDARHKAYTGVSNRTILENLRRADTLHIPLILRTPVIPGVNDDDENIRASAAFAWSLRNCVRYELLPYHPLGVSKQIALGLPECRFPIPTKERVKELQNLADLQRSHESLA